MLYLKLFLRNIEVAENILEYHDRKVRESLNSTEFMDKVKELKEIIKNTEKKEEVLDEQIKMI